MTTGAMARKKFWTLGERIVLEEGESAFTWNTRTGEMLDPFGIAVRFEDSSTKARVAAILRLGEIGQETCAEQNNCEKCEVETMPEFPITDEWHHDKDQERDS